MKSRKKPAANGKLVGRLVAVDGINGAALTAKARETIKTVPKPRRGGVSFWDASGIFGDLVVAHDDEAGVPSARTLLLLYAADLAFRLRWEIRPALAEGRVIVAAPYVATAFAFGRAAGLDDEWLANLFGFAPAPAEARSIAAPPARQGERQGFVEFGCDRLAARPDGPKRKDLIERARGHLRQPARGSR
jgi:thymidylate kinase